MFSVYVLPSAETGRLYTAYTGDVAHRLDQRNAGFSKSMKDGGPWKPAHDERFATRAKAMNRERSLLQRD